MTTIRPIPVDRYLVPATAPPPPATATTITQSLVRGLPATISLGALDLVLYLPTGDAILWRDADPAAPVALASEENAARAATDGEDLAARPPLRLVLRQGGVNIGSAPLRASLNVRLPDDGINPAIVELWVLDYAIYAGALAGAGDTSSMISLAWRRLDVGADTFTEPPLDPQVAADFAGMLQSTVGGGR